MADESKGNCSVHRQPFVHRQGISKSTGRAYDGWWCSEQGCWDKPRRSEEPARATGG